MEPVLQSLAIDLIKYIRFHLKSKNSKFEGNVINLLDQIQTYYRSVLDSLAQKLQEEIAGLDHEKIQTEQLHLESIELIQFAVFDLQTLWPKLLDNQNSMRKTTEILSNMLRGMNKISNDNQNLELIIPSLELVDKILNILEYIDSGMILNKEKQKPEFKQAIESFNLLYVKMSNGLIDRYNQNEYPQKLELDTFMKYNNIMLKIINLQDIDK